MRVNSVVSDYQTNVILNNDKVQKQNSTSHVTSKSISTVKNSGVILTFTGADKNINQFATYAPENKRYKLSQYNAGGLGVVAQEAPESWRREGFDVRDFSPYHSFGNNDGGIRVVKLAKDAKGQYLDNYKLSDFVTAEPNESLEDVRKRLKLPKNQELSFVIQQAPDKKGYAKIFKLEDTGIKGSVTRPGNSSILDERIIPYRIFRAVDIKDTSGVESDVAEKNSAYFVYTPRSQTRTDSGVSAPA